VVTSNNEKVPHRDATKGSMWARSTSQFEVGYGNSSLNKGKRQATQVICFLMVSIIIAHRIIALIASSSWRLKIFSLSPFSISTLPMTDRRGLMADGWWLIADDDLLVLKQCLSMVVSKSDWILLSKRNKDRKHAVLDFASS
jgi:hypothetical protein